MAQTLEHNSFVTQVTPVEIPLCGVDVEVIQKLDDEPNDVGGLSAQELKERFDHVGAELKSYLNERLIPTVVSNDLTEQVRQEAETERVKNERERVEKEAERETAETARVTAETARAGAESQRETAETGRATAEGARAAAETARATAETARITAETARAGAEDERETAEEARATAEAARLAAETARAAAENRRETAETGRGTAEEARVQAETARAVAETARETAEDERETAEGARTAAEAVRATAEAARETAEDGRETAEEARVQAEAARAVAEAVRETAEDGRETAEAARAAAEAARIQAETQRVDTDNGIVAQATAQATLAAGSAQSAGESAGAAAESAEAAAAAKTAAENAKTGAQTAKTAAEAAQTAAQTAKTAAEEQAQTATAAAAQSTAEANRAKLEADRAQAIAGGDFATSAELAEKADIPVVGAETLLETLPAGGVLLVTDGGSGDTAKAKQIAVKDKDGVLQVVELGGSGGARVNAGDLLKEIQIYGQSTFVRPREDGQKLTWAEVEALTPNTEAAPTAAEKEMFKDPDGTYSLKRIIYDSYIGVDQAISVMGAPVKAIAADETSKVTIYDKNWNRVTNSGSSQSNYAMNAKALPMFKPLRAGMDDMEVAVNQTPVDYDAQQRVYIDVERADGSAVDYYVLVIHPALQYNNNVGQYQFPAGTPTIRYDGRRGRGQSYPDDRIYPEGTQTADRYAIWVYPEGTDLSICPPNAVVSLWSNEAKAKIDAGDTGGLTTDQINTVTTYGATDEWGHPYPLAFQVRASYCEMLQIKMIAENSLSAVGIAGDNAQNPVRPKIYNWAQGKIVAYFDGIVGQTRQFYGGVRTQLQNMTATNENNHRGFTITVEFEVPYPVEFMLGSAAHITFPAGTGEKVYTISDGTDVKSSRTSANELFTVLQHCNATYQATVTVGGKTYTGQIVTGPYFGQCALSEWTEVTEE